MSISFKKTFKISLFSIGFLGITFLTTGCGPQLFVKHINSKGTILTISKDAPTSGDVILPQDVRLTNTIPELVKNRVSEYSYLYQEKDQIDVLVLPIHFKNNCNVLLEDVIKSNIDASLNGSDKKKVFPCSVKEFYSKSSFGNINLNFTISDWHMFPNSNFIKTQEDVDEIINVASRNAKINGEAIDLKRFDKNNDGYIDAIWAIYDMPNYTNNPNSNNNLFWAYTVSKHNEKNFNKNPIPSSYSFASYDFMDGYLDAINARTYIHETGHLFGLSDYYDYGNSYYPMAGFDMMDLNVFDHNAYSKMLLGWMEPFVVYGNATINEEDILKNNSCVVILEDDKELNYDSSNKFVFSPSREYMLLDYFDASDNSLNYFDLTYDTEQKNMPEISITESGYRLYHVDSRPLVASMKDKKVSAQFYNSNIPLNSNQKEIRVILNSSDKAEINETSLLTKVNFAELIEDKIDYYNEITLIAANSEKLNQNYKNLYYTYSSSSKNEKVRTPLTNEMLFNSGDKFEINEIYKKYFVKEGGDYFIKFNDSNEKFSTTIQFE